MNRQRLHRLCFIGLYCGMVLFIYFKTSYYLLVTPAMFWRSSIQSAQRMAAHTLPLMLFSLSELFEVKVDLRKPILVSMLSGLVFFAVGFQMFYWQRGLTFESIFGFKFEYEAAIEYLFFGIIFFELFRRKTHNDFKSFAYITMLLSAIGLLYELPIGYANPDAYFHIGYPTLIYSRWIMLALMLWKMGSQAFRSWLVLAALIPLALFSYYYHLNPNLYSWIPRLPMLTFWLIPVARMKEEVIA